MRTAVPLRIPAMVRQKPGSYTTGRSRHRRREGDECVLSPLPALGRGFEQTASPGANLHRQGVAHLALGLAILANQFK